MSKLSTPLHMIDISVWHALPVISLSSHSISMAGTDARAQSCERCMAEVAHRASLWVTGKEILESWNCFTLSRLHSAAGTVAVLMMLTLLARTRCREAISWYICDITPQSIVEDGAASTGDGVTPHDCMTTAHKA